MSRFFVRLLNGALLVCFLASIFGGWYLSRQGFGQKWRKKLAEEFARRGVQMTARRLTLDPLRGLVARDVRVFSNARQNQVIARMSELRLDIDYTRLLRNEPFLDALSLSEAELNLDFDPLHKNSGELVIHHLQAHFSFAADRVEVRRFQGEGLGLWFSLAGELDHGPEWQVSTDPTRFWKRLTSLSQPWVERLEELKFSPDLGRLNVRFRGDLKQPDGLQTAEVQVKYPRLRWKGAEFRDLKISADLARGNWSVRQFAWHDDRGTSSLSGNWDPSSGGEVHLRGELDVTPILQQEERLRGLSVDGDAQILADLSWKKSDASWQVLGRLDFADVLYHGVKWDRLQTRFAISPDRWLLQDLQLTQKNGVIAGQMLCDGGQVKLAVTSTVEPQSIWQTLAIHVPPVLAEAEFPVSPLVKLTATGPDLDPSRWQLSGEIILGRTHFRGVALTSGQGWFSAQGPLLSLREVQITRPEGQLTGELSWNAATGDLQFWNAKNSIDVVVLGLWLDSPWASAIETMRLPKGAVVEAAGRLRWKDDAFLGAEVQLSTGAAGILEAPFLHDLAGPLSSAAKPERFQAAVHFDGETFEIQPLTTGNGPSWNGAARWSMATGSFSGTMEVASPNAAIASQTWTANSPWSAIVWKQK